MKRISYWAKNNAAKARIIIALSEVMLFVLAVSLGIFLMRIDIYLPLFIAMLSLLLLVTAIITYPSKEILRKLRSKLYVRQKICDISISVSVFILVCFMVNRDKIIEWNIYTPLHGTCSSFKELNDGTPKKTVSKRQVRKELRAWRKKLRKDKDALTALYVALVIIGSLGLFVLLGGLVCGISCSGNEGLALVVLLAGTFGIVFLAVKLISNIIRHRKKTVKKNNTTAVLFPALHSDKI